MEYRNYGLELVMQFIKDGIVAKNDLVDYLRKNEPATSPERIRDEMEAWYKNMGIEAITGTPFRLSLPYFTEKEIIELESRGEVLLCLPGGICAAVLGKLFHMDCWAFHDPLVSLKEEHADFWFSAKKNYEPEYTDKKSNEIARKYKDDGKLNMSIERYMVFLARIKYLTGTYPDISFKTWLPNTRYEEKGVFVAGLDSNFRFSVLPWMPHFHSPKVGGRYVYIVDHH